VNWLRKLLGLCQHKWREDGPPSQIYGVDPDTGHPFIRGRRVYLRCEHCGNVTHRNLY
jgi:ribosomal protein S14